MYREIRVHEVLPSRSLPTQEVHPLKSRILACGTLCDKVQQQALAWLGFKKLKSKAMEEERINWQP